MVGMVRDDDPDNGDFAVDDLVVSESLARNESGGERRNSRRTLEEILEERRLKRQLRDVFAEDDWDD